MVVTQCLSQEHHFNESTSIEWGYDTDFMFFADSIVEALMTNCMLLFRFNILAYSIVYI